MVIDVTRSAGSHGVAAGKFAASRARLRGVTLIELLTVLAIMTSLLGISVTVYRKAAKTHALPAAVTQVSSIVRAARNFSLTSSLPSRVFVEPDQQRITAFGYEVVAAWHFEDAPVETAANGDLPSATELVGAFGERLTVAGSCQMVRGKIGKAIWFANDGAALIADHRSRYVAPIGLSLEAWVQFDPPEPPDAEALKRRRGGKLGEWDDPRREEQYAIISKEDSYELGLLGDGAVYLQLGDPKDEKTSYHVYTRGRCVLPGRWAHVRGSFDGFGITVEVDGIEVEWIPRTYQLIDERDWPVPPTRLSGSESYLSISHPERMFLGAIDEPKVRVAIEPRSYVLPTGVHFLGLKRQVIRFDTRGSLDPLYHTRPEVIQVGDEPRAKPEVTGMAPGRTAVMAEVKDESASRPTSDEVGDPLKALIEYYGKNAEGEIDVVSERSDGQLIDGAGGETNTSTTPNAGAKQPGRVQNVIIDLTGSIRG
ncbi:MAG: prepilin-type N-terminal cleavage/methylation domain-containing protein [Planctomycetota bacterium]